MIKRLNELLYVYKFLWTIMCASHVKNINKYYIVALIYIL